MIKQLIEPTTDPGQSEIQVPYYNGVRRTFVVNSDAFLAGVEKATIEYTSDNGVNWADLIIDGVIQELTVNTRAITISAPLILRINKDASVASVGISVIE